MNIRDFMWWLWIAIQYQNEKTGSLLIGNQLLAPDGKKEVRKAVLDYPTEEDFYNDNIYLIYLY